MKIKCDMFLILSFLFFAVFSCNENIVNCEANPFYVPKNVYAAENAYPFIVSIQIKRVDDDPRLRNITRFKHICGGSLITRKHVLTAAHCFHDNRIYADYRVSVGSNKLENGTIYYVKYWLAYDQWARDANKIVIFADDDISILELTDLVSSDIQLARITTASNDDLHGRMIISAGWGEDWSGAMSNKLMEVKLNLISRDRCMRNINNARRLPHYFLDKNKFCTNGTPFAILGCGDSGSPVLIEGNEIIGINCSICPAIPQGVTSKEQNLHIDVRLYSRFINAVIHNRTRQESNSILSCSSM